MVAADAQWFWQLFERWRCILVESAVGFAQNTDVQTSSTKTECKVLGDGWHMVTLADLRQNTGAYRCFLRVLTLIP